MKNLLHGNDKFVTINNNFSKIPPPTWMRFALVFEDGVFFVWVDHVSLWSAASKMRKRKFVSFIQFFSNVRSSSNPHKKSTEECAPD